MTSTNVGDPRAPARPAWTWWDQILDLLLTLWVLRAPVGGLVMGALILWLAPQAQDLLVELATDTYTQQFIFFTLLVLIWAAPTHYASRLLLNTDDRYLDRVSARGTSFIGCLRLWMPRALGTLPFAIMAGSVIRAWSNVPTVSNADYVSRVGFNLTCVAVALAVAGVLFLYYTIYRRKIAALFGWAERGATSAADAVTRRYPRLARRAGAPSRDATRRETGDAGGDGPVDSVLGPTLLVGMTLIFVGGPLIWPLQFAEAFPRSAAVPFVVGAWIPLLSFFASKGREHQFPWIAAVFAFISIVPAWAWVGNNYQVRRIEAAKQVIALVPKADLASLKDITGDFSFNDAVTAWKKANGAACVADGALCPRPIIVAAAGGASRAGFFTAGILGQLLDDALKVDGKGHGLPPAEVNKRLFAISSVSGSSVGAAMTVAALGASVNGAQPCKPRPFVLWFGDTRGQEDERKIGDWRSCLEALMAGDFLTPVFDGFVFRDMLRILHVVIPGWSDRAALLETGWEKHFDALVGEPASDPGGLRCSRSLSCPFKTLRPMGERWVPLLVLNGTSVGMGNRIVTSPLSSGYKAATGLQCPLSPRKNPCQLFLDTPLFHDLLVDSNPTKLNDLRLSTAAHNSARFPIISPPGEIFNNGGVIVDRIVDGGYFENFGAYTAGELVLALRAVDPKLNPFVLVLSNDPQIPEIDRSKERQATAAPGPTGPGKPATFAAGLEGNFLTDASGPVDAIMNARNAHGLLAVDALVSLLDEVRPRGACNVVTLKVWGEPLRDDPNKLRSLSMSWWLSKPVQIYLHEQTDLDKHGENIEAARAVLAALRPTSGDPAELPRCPR